MKFVPVKKLEDNARMQQFPPSAPPKEPEVPQLEKQQPPEAPATAPVIAPSSGSESIVVVPLQEAAVVSVANIKKGPWWWPF